MDNNKLPIILGTIPYYIIPNVLTFIFKFGLSLTRIVMLRKVLTPVGESL